MKIRALHSLILGIIILANVNFSLLATQKLPVQQTGIVARAKHHIKQFLSRGKNIVALAAGGTISCVFLARYLSQQKHENSNKLTTQSKQLSLPKNPDAQGQQLNATAEDRIASRLRSHPSRMPEAAVRFYSYERAPQLRGAFPHISENEMVEYFAMHDAIIEQLVEMSAARISMQLSETDQQRERLRQQIQQQESDFRENATRLNNLVRDLAATGNDNNPALAEFIIRAFGQDPNNMSAL